MKHWPSWDDRLTFWLGDPEEINGHDRCPTYLFRWFVLKTPWFKVYIHKFVGDDWSFDLHDHPKRFISVGLKGCYIEETPSSIRCYIAPWIRSFPANHIHRIRLCNDRQPCWTLVIALKTVREWGFWHEGKWIEWKSYVRGENSHIADKQKACID